MDLITRHNLAAQAANRWWLAYLSPVWHRPVSNIGAVGVHEKLLALGHNPTPEQVDAVMPNKSWTRLTCSACGEECERVVDIDVTAGEYSTQICEACVKKMAALFT